MLHLGRSWAGWQMAKTDPQNPGVKISYAFSQAAVLGVAATSYQPSPPIIAQQNAYIGSSRGTESVMAYDERLIDAKIEAVEARTETKFEKLLGELRVISTNVANLGAQMIDIKTEVGAVKTATAGVKWNIVALGLTMGGLIIAIAAFGTQILDLATSLVGVHK